MNVYSLFSGSRGNCTLITTKKYNLLIDVGVSMKRINEALLISEGIDLDDIDFVLISHVHSDHILSFNAIYNKYPHIKFVMNDKLKKEVEEHLNKQYDKNRFVLLDNATRGNNLTINYLELRHDKYCLGYTIEDMVSGESVCFIADNGEYPYKFKDIPLLHVPYTYYCIESNYDEYLQYIDETRNELLKRRVLSPSGHSSNFNAIEKLIIMLEQSNNDICRGVMFTHLSEHCNTEEISRKSHQAYMSTWGKKTITKGIKFSYAKQDEIVVI